MIDELGRKWQFCAKNVIIMIIQILQNLCYFIFTLDFTKVDVENPPTEGVKITMDDLSQMKSLCVRYYLESLTNQQIFSTPNYELTLLMYFLAEVGFVAMKGAWSIFPIPRQIKPYTYEHICYSHNMTHYIVAAEGEIWFIGTYSCGKKGLTKCHFME